MPRDRSPLEKAAGKLVSAIQKEWLEEMAAAEANESEQVMHTSHLLLQAASASGSIASVIGGGSVAAFLGQRWVDAHPIVLPFIRTLEGLEAGAVE